MRAHLIHLMALRFFFTTRKWSKCINQNNCKTRAQSRSRTKDFSLPLSCSFFLTTELISSFLFRNKNDALCKIRFSDNYKMICDIMTVTALAQWSEWDETRLCNLLTIFEIFDTRWQIVRSNSQSLQVLFNYSHYCVQTRYFGYLGYFGCYSPGTQISEFFRYYLSTWISCYWLLFKQLISISDFLSYSMHESTKIRPIKSKYFTKYLNFIPGCVKIF